MKSRAVDAGLDSFPAVDVDATAGRQCLREHGEPADDAAEIYAGNTASIQS